MLSLVVQSQSLNRQLFHDQGSLRGASRTAEDSESAICGTPHITIPNGSGKSIHSFNNKHLVLEYLGINYGCDYNGSHKEIFYMEGVIFIIILFLPRLHFQCMIPI